MKTYITRSVIPLALQVAATSLALQVNGQMLTFEFSGSLTEVMNDPYGYASEWGSVGDPFTGYLSYDPSFWNINPGGGNASTEEYYYKADGYSDPEAAITFSISTPSMSGQIPGAAPFSIAWVN